MTRTRAGSWLRGRWAVPIVSGALIAASFAVHGLAGNRSANPLAGDALMIAAALVAGLPIVLAAIKALRSRVIGIDLLVSVASIGAVIVGEFWEAAAVTFLFAVGGALENATLNRTRSALRELVRVAPEVAVVLREGRQEEVAASGVRTGETVLVKNGAKVPVDGTVLEGTGTIDEAAITGESLPVEKLGGDQVFAGTIATGGFLQVRATDVGADTTLARIIHRVEDAQDAKAKTARFMDRFSAWYTPGIIALSLAVGLLTKDTELALTLLVIGCPGALVISIPVSVVAGIGRGARDGILIKGGEFLETSARISAVAVDKTGTLTEGRPELTDVEVLHGGWTADELLGLAARAEAGSEHPLARPLVEAAAQRGMDVSGRLAALTEPVAGKGVLAVLDGQRVAVGNRRLMEAEGVQIGEATATLDRLSAEGRTAMLVAADTTLLGVVAVADRVRDDAAEMVRRLHSAGVHKVVMLTGDDERVARAVGAAVGVDEVHAGLLPEDKLNAVVHLQREGEVVAMVGDGVNDAPALATANIGVAMGAAGTGVAIETADIALMADDLLKLPRAIRLARRTVSVMHQNILIALVTVAVLLTGVLVGGVTMAVGMLVHEASVLVVIINAMRLLRRKANDTWTDTAALRHAHPTPDPLGRSARHRARPAGRAGLTAAGDVEQADARTTVVHAR
ncbi:Cd2+/Zn2+-exporting ATPase [Propionibacterium cyclohexanicum]|uniref:Cd2+/Zn2+-exporting ATPase n=1 Tax=Propionibacterium cyclohexanicum TaxID=64702 RepID=A0A1H9R917_9ACTN|nr:cation-translocating P-type ATPase [Propionibacterium cyclohexanicum]SER68539.1 Cd2+/Zn2+-exporting ATPase [Propionibacterium cyclohexanicum]